MGYLTAIPLHKCIIQTTNYSEQEVFTLWKVSAKGTEKLLIKTLAGMKQEVLRHTQFDYQCLKLTIFCTFRTFSTPMEGKKSITSSLNSFPQKIHWLRHERKQSRQNLRRKLNLKNDFGKFNENFRNIRPVRIPTNCGKLITSTS